MWRAPSRLPVTERPVAPSEVAVVGVHERDVGARVAGSSTVSRVPRHAVLHELLHLAVGGALEGTTRRRWRTITVDVLDEQPEVGVSR